MSEAGAAGLAHAPSERLSHHILEAIENTRLGMWVFLGSETVFFATMIGMYLALHGNRAGGPGPKQLFDMTLSTIATCLLLISSLTMALAVAAAQDRNAAAARRWLMVTILLGLCFIANQAIEFPTIWTHGQTLETSAFGSAFFTLTGFHGLHVSFGLLWLIVWVIHLRPGKPLTAATVTQIETAGLYWAFVDVVWIVIFTIVYLIGVLS